MIDETVMRNIINVLEDWLPIKEWNIIPSMFERVYKLTVQDREVYALSRWDKEVPVLCFDVTSGDFVSMELPEYVLEYGVLV